MRKLSVFLLGTCICLSGNILSAQNVRIDQVFGLGATTSNISGTASLATDTSLINSDYTLRLRQFGIVYGAKVDVLAWKFGSISLSSPVMLGFSTSSNYRSIDFNGAKRDTIEGLRGTRLAFELPLFADLNIGLHSAADESEKSNIGVYVGAGYMYSYTRIRTSVGNVSYDGFDPCLHAGIRMGRTWENRFSIVFTVRGNFKNNSPRTYGLQILKEL